MNAKKEKAARRLFRSVCRRNGVTPTQHFWKRYRSDLKSSSMWEQFLINSKIYLTNHHN